MVDKKRRDFLQITAATMGIVGVGSLAWPFLKQLAPIASPSDQPILDVNVASLQPGMEMTVKWMGKPVVIRNRTQEEIQAAAKVNYTALKDPLARNLNLPSNMPATDLARSAGEGHENWLVVIGLCTHLGCLPISEPGATGGWVCPCHGSIYDSAGRVLSGPAGQNLAIPPYKFIAPDIIRLGQIG